MLIKDEYKLQVGSVIKFRGQDLQNISGTKIFDVVVKEIYPHWVLGHILDFENNDDVVLKICMSNVELVMQGIYKVDAIKENFFNVPIKTEFTEEYVQKMEEFTKTHSTKLIRNYIVKN